MQCGISHLSTVQEILLYLSDLQEVYSGNRQIHTQCHFYTHPIYQQVANVTSVIII